jgi:putative ABC transport system permease protein
MLWTEDPTQNLREGRSALWSVEQWRSQSQSFADMATFDSVSMTLAADDGAEQIVGASISPNLLPLLGIQPALGRSFSADEAEQQQRLVLISHRFWQARFGGSHDALGATLVLNGVPRQIVGILPADFEIAMLAADVWVAHASRQDARGPDTWFVVGRLRPAATFDQAQEEMSTVARRLNDQLPANERNRGITVVPLTLYMVAPQSRLALWILGGAVFCVFLIAAANVTSLSLARSVTRAREIAVRAALGASAGRIVRQLLTESVLLAAVSGLIGTLLAFVGIRLIRAFGPPTIPRLNETALDLQRPRLGPGHLCTRGDSCGTGARTCDVAPQLAPRRRRGRQKCHGGSGRRSHPPRPGGRGVRARDRVARWRRPARPKLVVRQPR